LLLSIIVPSADSAAAALLLDDHQGAGLKHGLGRERPEHRAHKYDGERRHDDPPPTQDDVEIVR
jgi:hypothetical protein